jgi:Ca2+-binding RTX toxin-like protein
VVRQAQLIALVVAFLIGCAVVLMAGASEVLAEASQQNKQKHTEATSEATREQQELYGGPRYDRLRGGVGKDVLHGAGGDDFLEGGAGDDVIYGGDGSDTIFAVEGEDVLYGGEGNDYLDGRDEGGLKDKQRDEIFCGAGRDKAIAGKLDYVDSSCENEELVDTGGPPWILLAGAALCTALMMLRYVIRSA